VSLVITLAARHNDRQLNLSAPDGHPEHA